MILKSVFAYYTQNKSIFLSVILITIAGFFVYFNSLNGEFIYDDELWVKDNPHIKNWSGINRIFTEGVGIWEGRKYHFYRPFQTLTYAIDYSLWKLNPKGYHLTNILLHILVALSIFWLINISYRNIIISFFTSILFVVHPIHTEAVSYISGRAEPLAVLFMLLGLIFYIKRLPPDRFLTYSLVAVSYLSAILSKEYGLWMPFLLLIYHYSFKIKLNFKYFLCLLFTLFFYTLLRLNAIENIFPSRSFKDTVFERLPGFFVALFDYPRLLLLPFDLHMEYGYKWFGFTEPKAIFGFLILVCMLFLILGKKTRNGLISFSVIWFILTLLPQSNLFPVNAYMAEHWLYLPSVGFFLILGCGLNYLCNFRKLKILGIALSVVLVIFYSFLTLMQNNYWRNALVFYERNLRFAPQSVKLLNNLALIRKDMGKHGEAISLLEKARLIDPTYVITYNNLANSYEEIDNHEKAAQLYKEAIKIDPDYSEAYCNLGVVYIKLGEKEKAIPLFKKAAEINPYNVKAHNNLGSIYKENGNYKEAIGLYRRVIKIAPHYSGAYYNLGIVYAEIGEKEKAITEFKKAVELNPRNPRAYNNLGNLYKELGQVDEALLFFKKAIELNPEYANAYNNLGITLASVQRTEEAIAAFKKAIEIDKNLASAHNNLSVVYYYEKQYDLAVKHCDIALELGYKVSPELLKFLDPFRQKVQSEF